MTNEMTTTQYNLLLSAARARCLENAAVYGLTLSRYADQQGYSNVAKMIEWEATVIHYGGELKPNACLVVRGEVE